MRDVQHKKPDLVVLDDPVSSFDKTKKFAILHQLFHGKNSLRDTTTLLLTHDIEPAIDVVRSGTSGQFVAADPVVHFLIGRLGTVTEKPIGANDIATFSEVCETNIATASDVIVRCIHLRRFFEVHGARGVAYELLSSLLHARDQPTRKLSATEHELLTEEEVSESTAAIRKYIGDFDYKTVLTELKEPGALKIRFDATEVGYEKVQIFRIMLSLDSEGLKSDQVFTKSVNDDLSHRE